MNNRGGFFHNLTAITTAIIVGFLVWPLLLPINGLGANYAIISPLNWVLEVVWLMILTAACVVYIRRRQARSQQVERKDEKSR